MESILLPFLLVIIASVFQGSFGVGMKYMPPLKWESWWLVHVTVAMVLFPIVWTFLSVSEDIVRDDIVFRYLYQNCAFPLFEWLP